MAAPKFPPKKIKSPASSVDTSKPQIGEDSWKPENEPGEGVQHELREGKDYEMQEDKEEGESEDKDKSSTKTLTSMNYRSGDEICSTCTYHDASAGTCELAGDSPVDPNGGCSEWLPLVNIGENLDRYNHPGQDDDDEGDADWA